MQKYVIALYIRLSLEDSKYDSLSIENQQLILNEYAAAMPESARAEVIEFIDNGYSGTNFERPQVQKLIGMVKENRIDCIIVKDFSRFGRNSIETGYFIERVFPLFHTRFISIGDDFDTENYKGDTGGMDVAFKYLINEYYSRDMSVKTKSAKYAKMQRGEYQSKICPYGYRKSADGRMEADPETAPVIKLIFRLSAIGICAADIARELYKRRIPTPGEYKAMRGIHMYDVSRAGGAWNSSTVLRILEDERYIGTYVAKKSKVVEIGSSHVRKRDRSEWIMMPDHHEPLVDKELFEKAKEKQTRYSQPNKRKREYLLRGKVYCGCCDHALSRLTQKTICYICRSSKIDRATRCYDLKISADELHMAVLLDLKNRLEAGLGNGEHTAINSDALIPERRAYEKQVEDIIDGKRLLYERYLMGEMDLDEYLSEKTAYDDLLINAKNSYSALRDEIARETAVTLQDRKRQEAASLVFEKDELTEEMAELIDRVYVFPDKRVEVAYKDCDLF